MEAPPHPTPIRLMLYLVFLKVGKVYTFQITWGTCENEASWTPTQIQPLEPRIWSLVTCTLKTTNSPLHIEVCQSLLHRSSMLIFARVSTTHVQTKIFLLTVTLFSFSPGTCCEGFLSRGCWQSPGMWERTETRVAIWARADSKMGEKMLRETGWGKNPSRVAKGR